jgi:hypothetical protein
VRQSWEDHPLDLTNPEDEAYLAPDSQSLGEALHEMGVVLRDACEDVRGWARSHVVRPAATHSVMWAGFGASRPLSSSGNRDAGSDEGPGMLITELPARSTLEWLNRTRPSDRN